MTDKVGPCDIGPDDGVVVFGVASDFERGVVVLNWRAPGALLSLPPRTARELAIMLLRHAEQIETRPRVAIPS